MMEKDKCPDCWSDNIIHNRYDQVVCRECGLIYEELSPDDQELLEKAQQEPA